MRERLLSETRGPALGEALVAAGLFLVLALLAYGSYVADGGFYSDDWSHAANYHFAESVDGGPGGPGYGNFQLAYDRLYFYDARGQAEPVGSRRECHRALVRYSPGPLEA
jgi:hypothetical protein